MLRMKYFEEFSKINLEQLQNKLSFYSEKLEKLRKEYNDDNDFRIKTIHIGEKIIALKAIIAQKSM